jgi:hypothetical protein
MVFGDLTKLQSRQLLRRSIGRKVYTFLWFVECFGKIVSIVYVAPTVLVNSSR